MGGSAGERAGQLGCSARVFHVSLTLRLGACPIRRDGAQSWQASQSLVVCTEVLHWNCLPLSTAQQKGRPAGPSLESHTHGNCEELQRPGPSTGRSSVATHAPTRCVQLLRNRNTPRGPVTDSRARKSMLSSPLACRERCRGALNAHGAVETCHWTVQKTMLRTLLCGQCQGLLIAGTSPLPVPR